MLTTLLIPDLKAHHLLACSLIAAAPNLFLYVGFWIDKDSLLHSLTPLWPYTTFPFIAYCSLRCSEYIRLVFVQLFQGYVLSLTSSRATEANE